MIKIMKYDKFKSTLNDKTFTPSTITDDVSQIIANVIKRGDEAVREYTEKFDGCLLENFEVPPSAFDVAIHDAGTEFVEIMERAARNIESYHSNQIQKGFDLLPKDGVILGQKVTPIERVGLYIPGGTAPYPSSVLMNCIPARIAGVKEIIIATPPSKSDDKNTIYGINMGILAAAKIAGANRVFAIGGAQAIAALAYGTETIPRVDKITGPGNAYVAEAKRQVFGIVGIDMIAGPSDILIIADKTADPVLIATDMLSQCEHGTDSPAILVTDSMDLANKVKNEIETQLPELPRSEIAREAIEEHGRIIIAGSIKNAFEISNEIAPEHLEIFLDESFKYLDNVKNAGSIFLGKNTPETLGDYYAGPNHTLPTSGTSRFSSQLSVDDFIKKTSYTYYTKDALINVSDDVIKFAEKEGLTAHALSVSKRINEK